MTAVDLRLAFRLHRFEIVGFVVLVGLVSLAAVAVAAALDATGYGAHCSQLDGNNPPGCEAMGRAFYALEVWQVPTVRSILAVLPFAMAVLAGVPLVARELERGTSRLAWSLAPSRLRWFVVRAVPVAAVVFGLSFLAGAALDRLAAAVNPGVDVTNGFVDFGTRGVVLAARAVFVFAVAVLLGAIVGRVLPAMIVAAVVAWVGITGGSHVHGEILASEAVLVASETGAPGDMFVDQRVRLPDGRLVSWDTMTQLYPPPADPEAAPWPPAGISVVAFVVPGARYRLVELREVGALAGGSLVALGLAAAAVRRRRPG